MILVTGATGFIGRHVVQQLRVAQLPVRCLLPNYRMNHLPWAVDGENAPEVVEGTILDEEAIFRAVTGVHTIIHLESAMWWGRERNLERIELSGTNRLIAAARSARVGRIIYLSHLGAAPSSAYTLHRIKGQVEDIVRRSGLAYTIIRPGLVFGAEDAFVSHLAMMMRSNMLFFLMPGEGDTVLHPIHIDDLVRAILLSLESVALVDKVIEIGGPEYITFEDMLLTIMRVTGMYRLIFSVPPYFVRLFTALTSRIFPRTLMTPQWLDILATNRTTQLGNIYEYFGFQPRRFEDTLLTYLPQENHFMNLLRYPLRRRPRGV